MENPQQEDKGIGLKKPPRTRTEESENARQLVFPLDHTIADCYPTILTIVQPAEMHTACFV